MSLRLALLLAVTLVLPARAAGPLIVNGAGAPLVWTTIPVPFNPDLGTLGTLGNAGAVTAVTNNFNVWAAVSTTSLSFVNAGSMPVDVTSANYTDYVGVCGDGLSPIIFDTNGTITDDLLGTGASNSVLGFAGPDCGTLTPPVITEGIAVLNGKWIDGISTGFNPEISLSDFNAVFIHEFGHYVNLDHSQVGLAEAQTLTTSDDDGIATMFPFLVNGAATATLHLDDEASVSALYPAPGFTTGRATITGHVLLSDGTRPFQSAFVIARKLGDGSVTAVGGTSGGRYAPTAPGGPPPASLEGLYELRGLPPGSYTVEIQGIDPSFSGGSGMGQLDPPPMLPGPPEFWNDTDEAGGNPPDDPTVAVPIAVSAGTTTSNIDVVINAPTPPACGAAPASGCRRPTLSGKASVTLKHNAVDAERDQLTWRWSHGAQTLLPEYGNPLGATGYTLCIYDASGGTPSLVVQAQAPAGGNCGTHPCWKQTGISGYTYRDGERTPDGLSNITLKVGSPGRARITVRGKGAALGLPATALAQDTAVTVQLQSSDNVCWEAIYSAPAKKNQAGFFVDKSD
jgi:hypothetical protein